MNYLAGRLGSDLRSRSATTAGDAALDYLDGTGASLLGALDLGGASAQIVFHAPKPPWRSGIRADEKHGRRVDNGDGRSLDPGDRSVRREDFYSESLLGCGAGPVRDMMEAQVEASADKEEEFTSVLNPCYFRGYQRKAGNVTHTGSGDGAACLQLLDEILSEKMDDAGDRGRNLRGAPRPRGDFYATTMYYYTIDFVRAVLAALIRAPDTAPSDREEYVRVQGRLAPSHPSLGSLRAAVGVACGWRYDLLQRHSAAYSELTSPEQMPRRCLGLSHTVVLLQKLGFFREDNRVHFVNVIRNQTAEWTLGAFLHITNHDGRDAGVRGTTAWANTQGPPLSTFVPMTWFLMLATGCIVASLRCQGPRRPKSRRPQASNKSRG